MSISRHKDSLRVHTQAALSSPQTVSISHSPGLKSDILRGNYLSNRQQPSVSSHIVIAVGTVLSALNRYYYSIHSIYMQAFWKITFVELCLTYCFIFIYFHHRLVGSSPSQSVTYDTFRPPLSERRGRSVQAA